MSDDCDESSIQMSREAKDTLTIQRATSLRVFAAAVFVRSVVFVIEQKISITDEFDDNEDGAVHFVGYTQGCPITTCRYRIIEDGRIAKIERVATLLSHRGKGYSRKLLHSTLDHIRQNSTARAVVLSSQDQAIKFYQLLGFVVCGDGYIEDGIPHHKMFLPLH